MNEPDTPATAPPTPPEPAPEPEQPVSAPETPFSGELVQLSIRVPQSVRERLETVSKARKKARAFPFNMQDIIAFALTSWMDEHGTG